MTVSDVVLEIGRIKPHQYTQDTILRWLSEFDGRVWDDLLCNYEEEKPELPYKPSDTVATLLIPFPYEDVYIKWLTAQIDFHNGDIERYNNSMAMFTEQYQAYLDSYTRSHLAKPVWIKGVRGDFA